MHTPKILIGLYVQTLLSARMKECYFGILFLNFVFDSSYKNLCLVLV